MNYGIEELMQDIEDYMKANLNAKIDAINAEIADDVILKNINDNAYFFQSLDDRVSNYDPFVFYGLGASVESDGIGPAVSKTIPINVVVISFDQNRKEIGKRYLRYNRALEEIFLSGWESYSNGGIRMKVRSPVLIDFTDLNTTNAFRTIGVELEATIA